MRSNIIESIVKNIKNNNRFLITAHINPDGDSLGSQLALYHMLKNQRKQVCILSADPVPAGYRFLPGSSRIIKALSSKEKFDVIFILDCNTKSRVGPVEDYLKKSSALVINIDHHPDNNRFGDINWINTGASSVGEMLYSLLKAVSLKLTRKAAVCFYTAILTDTGSFHYTNTQPQTFRTAGELAASGIKPAELASKIYQNRSVASLRLLASVLSTLQLSDQGRLCWIKATPDMFKKVFAREEDTENFVNYPRLIHNVEASVFFCQHKTDGKIKANFRSKGKIDVGKIARRFGGGGHFAASGAALSGDMDEIIKKVLREIRKYL